MADISMCLKEDCPSFKHCYNAQAKPNTFYQSYTRYDNGDNDKCSSYVPVASKLSIPIKQK